MDYQKRLQGKHLILTANVDDKPVGFKIGYKRNDDGAFYSWCEWNVLPKHLERTCIHVEGINPNITIFGV